MIIRVEAERDKERGRVYVRVECISEGEVRVKFPLGNISNRTRERERRRDSETHREVKREIERRRIVEKKKKNR